MKLPLMRPLIPLLLLASSLPLALAKRVPPSSSTPATPDPPSRTQPQPPARSLSSSTPPSPDSYLVTSLPGLAPSAFPTPHFAGHISVTPGSFSPSDPDRFFSWFFHPSAPSGAPLSSIPADTPLLIWLNGGPACSSMDGLWLENGPFRLSSAEPPSVAVNEHSWHRAPAYALYVDQPVGTGLSFTTHAKYPRNDAEVNEAFHGFLLNFLKIHDLEDAPVFFAGESHAGHYIPSMIADIRRRNAAGATVQIDVRGAAIGNGWFDPRSQYDVSGFAYGAGFIGLPERRYLEERNAECQAVLDSGSYRSGKCFDLMDDVVKATKGEDGKKVNVYDTRIWGTSSKSYPPGHLDVERYLGNPDVAARRAVLERIHALGADDAGQIYKECTDPPYNALAGNDGLGVVPDVVEILESGEVELLFFNGMNDVIVNHVSNEIALEALPYSKVGDFKHAKRQIWSGGLPGTGPLGPRGWLKSAPPLHYLKIAESGHMVPMDQPELALEMIRELLGGRIGGAKEQRLGVSDVEFCGEGGGGAGGGGGGGAGGGGGGGGVIPTDALPCGPSEQQSNAVVGIGLLVLLACLGFGFHKKRGGTLCGGRELEGRYTKVPTNTAVDEGGVEMG